MEGRWEMEGKRGEGKRNRDERAVGGGGVRRYREDGG